MTTSFNTPGPASEPAPVRPGRKLGPIADTVSSSHRAWLEPTREHYLASGRTLSDLSRNVLAKSKLSELLRGVGHYPRWEVIHRLAGELDIPGWPLYRLWKQAAMDAGKSRDWVDRSTEGTTAVATARSDQPLEHWALCQTVVEGYLAYAGVFLTDGTHKTAVDDTFAILWLCFDEALASPDIRRYTWNILRATVKAKANYRDERPVLAEAAFDTISLSHPGPEEQPTGLAEILELFTAISKLPDAQLDVMVLRRLCGFQPKQVSDLLGIPLAAVRSDERHARRFLDDTIELPPRTGGPTP
ncbi:sigma-70 family RNA polymerase sigma factor [Streptomyces sp. NPDC058682]|uniref:sigma-70 family RNA polymerase sigma factor n=1 Tax=unclassified Streptomyces TaxID=2593676 RepID=UPI00225A486F|nr:sigma-70 family RNA polymerase sigma factor [Streptomyces sp. NBC_01214]MCX4804532.1 sigma-70 family RNA polymerase sigma factor [Streptomyces sp. NBC_01214]